jgi:hypothetical protein
MPANAVQSRHGLVSRTWAGTALGDPAPEESNSAWHGHRLRRRGGTRGSGRRARRHGPPPALRQCLQRQSACGPEAVVAGRGSRSTSNPGSRCAPFAPTARRRRWRAVPAAESSPHRRRPRRIRYRTRSELAVAVTNQASEPMHPSVQVHQEVAGLLGDPRPGWVGGDPGQMDPPPLHLDHEQNVQAGQADRLDREEVAGQHTVCLDTQELGPSRPTPARRWPDPMPTQDPPHRRRRHPHAEVAALPHDPNVSQR